MDGGVGYWGIRDEQVWDLKIKPLVPFPCKQRILIMYFVYYAVFIKGVGRLFEAEIFRASMEDADSPTLFPALAYKET